MVALIQLMPNLDPWYCVTVEIFSMCPRKYFQTRNILQWNKISNLFILLLTYFKGGAFRLFSYQKLINLKGVQEWSTEVGVHWILYLNVCEFGINLEGIIKI